MNAGARLRLRLAWAMLAMLAMMPVMSLAQPILGDEALLKAAYVFNFARFVQWPEPEEAHARLQLCVAGEDEAALALGGLGGRVVQGRILRVRYLGDGGPLRDCQLLYLSANEPGARQAALIAASRGQPILTLSDAPHFARQGGHIELVRQGRRLRFIVNLTALRASGLEMSPNLLRLAQELYTD